MSRYKVPNPKTVPATKLGQKLSQFKQAPLPEEYDDTQHGPPPYFIKYEGMIEKMCEVMDIGGTQEDAAAFGGISVDTFRHWLRRGRKIREAYEAEGEEALTGFWDREYIALVELFELKDAEERLELLSKIKSAGEDQWQANAWLLERKHGFTTSNTVKHEHSGPGGGPVKFTLDLGDKTEDVNRAIEAPVEEADWDLLEDGDDE